MARTCVFCGERRKLSAEHVWPSWLNDVIPGVGVAEGFSHSSGFSDEGEQYAFDSDVLNQTARFVCIECNTGWMNDLETAVRPIISPMIQNTTTTMLKREQRVVAAWTMKTAMTIECTFRASRRAIRPDLYTAFHRDTSRPPAGVQISLVHYFGQDPFGVAQRSFPLWQFIDSPDTKWFLSSFRIGYLGAQVFGGGKGNRFLRRKEPGRTDTMLDLWPPPGRVITWPPRLAMDDKGWETFSSLQVDAPQEPK